MIVRILGGVVFATSVAIVSGLSMDHELSANGQSGTTFYCQTTIDDGCPTAFDIRGNCCRNAKGAAAVYWCHTTPPLTCVSAANVSCLNGTLYNTSCASPAGKWGNIIGGCLYSTTSCK